MVLKAKINKTHKENKEATLDSVRQEEMIRLNTLVPESLHKRLKVYAANAGRGITITNIVIEAIEIHLRKIS